MPAAEVPTTDVLEAPAVPMLELVGVRAAYGKVDVLHGIDLEVPTGALFAILGPNGAGKSTTLKVISGLLPPRAGTVRLVGHDVAGASAEALAQAGVCLIPEGRGIFPNLTVQENILMDSYAGGRHAKESGALEEATFTHFPRLGERRHQVAGTLSGGEQQMLALSRALSTDPALILIDELSMGLAPKVVEDLFAVVEGLAATGVSIVLVEQFAEAVLDFVDHAAVLVQGRIRLSGSPSEVRSELAAAYLGGHA